MRDITTCNIEQKINIFSTVCFVRGSYYRFPGAQYLCIFLRVVLYFDEPAGRTKTQTMNKNIDITHENVKLEINNPTQHFIIRSKDLTVSDVYEMRKKVRRNQRARPFGNRFLYSVQISAYSGFLPYRQLTVQISHHIHTHFTRYWKDTNWSYIISIIGRVSQVSISFREHGK